MKLAKRYQINWPEENLTAHYYWCLKQLESRYNNQISIHCEIRQYNEKHIFEGYSAKTAPRIDMEFSKWYSKFELVFQVEAKLIFEKNKKTTKGRSVSAKIGHKRYIETGISHFQTGYYPMPGCMVGYVVEGSVAYIIDAINALVKEPEMGKINNQPSSDFPEMHVSSLNTAIGEVELMHFMLTL
jgi:hypothetical protein